MFGELKDLEVDRQTLTYTSGEGESLLAMTVLDAEQYLIDLDRNPIYKDERKAEDALRALRADSFYHDGKPLQLSLCGAMQTLRRFGHTLYFLFSGKALLLWLVLLLSFVALPFLLNNSLGMGPIRLLGTTAWLLPSIANAPGWTLNDETLLALEQGNLEFIRRFMLAQNQLIGSALTMQLAWDLSFIGVAILIWLLLRYVAFRQWILVERDSLSVSKFTLRVSNLPSQPFTKEELLDFFQTAFQEKIVSATFSYDITEVHPHAVRIERLGREIDRLKADNLHSGAYTKRIQVLEARVAAERDQVSIELRNLSGLGDGVAVPLVKADAFLLFEESVVPKLITGLLEQSRTMTYVQKLVSENKDFSKFVNLKVSLSDDPASLRFENYGLSARTKSNEVIKTVLVGLLLCALLVSLFLLMEGGIKAIKPNYRCGASSAVGKGGRLFFRSDFSDEEYACFCRNNSRLRASTALVAFCADYRAQTETFFGLMAFPILFILLGNSLIAWFSDKASRTFRFYSQTNQFTAGLTIAVSLCLVNTLLCLVLSSDFFVGFPADDSELPLPFQPRSGLWVVELCNKAMWLAVLLVVVPQLALCLWYSIDRWAKDKRASKALWQGQFIARKGPADFPLLAQYALLYNIILFLILFSGAVPLLCIFCFLALLGLYWAEKFVFLAYCRKPPVLRELPISTLLRLWMPLALILRIILSIIINNYAFVTFDSKDLYSLRSIEGLAPLYDNATSGQAALRKSLPLAIIVLLFTLFLTFEDFVCRGAASRHLQNLLTRSSSNSNYQEAQKAIAIHSAPSYNLFQIPRYRAVFQTPMHSPEDLLLQNINTNFCSFESANLRHSKFDEEKIDADMDELLKRFSKDGTITEVEERDTIIPADLLKAPKTMLSVIPEVNEELYQSSYPMEEDPEQMVGSQYKRLHSEEDSPPLSNKSSSENLATDPR